MSSTTRLTAQTIRQLASRQRKYAWLHKTRRCKAIPLARIERQVVRHGGYDRGHTVELRPDVAMVSKSPCSLITIVPKHAAALRANFPDQVSGPDRTTPSHRSSMPASSHRSPRRDRVSRTRPALPASTNTQAAGGRSRGCRGLRRRLLHLDRLRHSQEKSRLLHLWYQVCFLKRGFVWKVF